MTDNTTGPLGVEVDITILPLLLPPFVHFVRFHRIIPSLKDEEFGWLSLVSKRHVCIES